MGMKHRAVMPGNALALAHGFVLNLDGISVIDDSAALVVS